MGELAVLHDLIGRVNTQPRFQGRLLAVDPGETTGISVFERDGSTTLLHADQIPTWPIEDCVTNLTTLLREYSPNFVVYESYHIYSWRLDEHKFAEVPTIQIIGSLKTLLIQRNIPFHPQTAQIGKGFCTDAKLKDWNLYLPGLVHARDSIRHGCHYLLFGSKRNQK